MLTGEDDSVLWRGAPGLHEVDGVATSKRGVPCEHHTGRLVDSAQLTVDVGEVPEATAFDKLHRGWVEHIVN